MLQRAATSMAALGAVLIGGACTSQVDSSHNGAFEPTLEPHNAEAAQSANGMSEAEVIRAEFAALDEALNATPNDPEVLAWKERLNSASDVRAGIFLSIDAGEGRTVKFFETPTGDKMIAEVGPIDVVPALEGLTDGSFEGVYRHLNPGAEVPERVLEADARLLEPMAHEPAQAEVPEAEPCSAAGEHGQKHATRSCSHFKSHNTCRSSDTQWCACELSGSTSGSRNGVQYSVQFVGSYKGSVTFEIDTSDSNGPWAYAVSEGEIIGRSMTSASRCGCAWWNSQACVPCKFAHSGRVYNASGDRYHWGACFDKDGDQTRAWHCLRR